MEPPCRVCDNPQSATGYHGRVCNACRTFFYRNCSKRLELRCWKFGNCEINYQRLRRNCAACRLKKCRDANMFKDDYPEEAVNGLYLSKSYGKMKTMLEMYGNIMNSGFKIIGNLNNSGSTSEWIDRLAYYESTLLSLNGATASSVTANTAMSLYDLVMYPGVCIDRSTKAIDLFSDSQADILIPYKLRETLLRQTVAAIENLSLIEEFHLLPAVDKVRLVQQNAGMMSCCFIVYTKFSQGWDPQTCTKYLERFRIEGGLGVLWRNIVETWSYRGLARLNEMLEEIRPTEKEMMLLRIRSYFRPCVEHTDEGHPIIIQTRLKLATYLGEHIRQVNPYFSYGEVQDRLCRILEMEDFFKTCATGFKEAYVMLTSLGAFGFDTPLTHDIFIKNY